MNRFLPYCSRAPGCESRDENSLGLRRYDVRFWYTWAVVVSDRNLMAQGVMIIVTMVVSAVRPRRLGRRRRRDATRRGAVSRVANTQTATVHKAVILCNLSR